MKKDKKVIIFDLDGTLAEFPEGSFDNSQLKKRLSINAENYLSVKLGVNLPQSKKIIESLRFDFGEELSIGVEECFGIDRSEFLNNVWNITDDSLIKKNYKLKDVVKELSNNFNLFILSDAPKVWVDFVLLELSLFDFFTNRKFTGEGAYRKSLGNAHGFFLEKVGVPPEQCISIGDQEKTDIVPAKKLGMKAILVSQLKTKSVADAIIKDLSEITKFIYKY